jgi:hypothetical protein
MRSPTLRNCFCGCYREDRRGGGSRVLAKNLPRDRFFSPAGTVMRFVDNAVPRVFRGRYFLIENLGSHSLAIEAMGAERSVRQARLNDEYTK